jgi:prolipoprotein diacylglyceryltransferase
MITKYYILTPSQKIELFIVTILFFLIFLLLKPMIFHEPFHGPSIGNTTILFFIWYGLTLIMANTLMVSNQKLNQTEL